MGRQCQDQRHAAGRRPSGRGPARFRCTLWPVSGSAKSAKARSISAWLGNLAACGITHAQSIPSSFAEFQGSVCQMSSIASSIAGQCASRLRAQVAAGQPNDGGHLPWRTANMNRPQLAGQRLFAASRGDRAARPGGPAEIAGRCDRPVRPSPPAARSTRPGPTRCGARRAALARRRPAAGFRPIATARRRRRLPQCGRPQAARLANDRAPDES